MCKNDIIQITAAAPSSQPFNSIGNRRNHVSSRSNTSTTQEHSCSLPRSLHRNFGNKRIRTNNRSTKKQQTENQFKQKSNHWKSDRYVPVHILYKRTRHFMRKKFQLEIVITIIPIHIELKSPSLTICPKLYFVFCGNSVEIHVPTIALLNSLPVCIYTCEYVFFLSSSLFIIAFIYTQIHNPNTEYRNIPHMHHQHHIFCYLLFSGCAVQINRVEWVHLTCFHMKNEKCEQ